MHVLVVTLSLRPECVLEVANKITLLTLVYSHPVLLFLIHSKLQISFTHIFALVTLECVVQSDSKAVFGIFVFLKSYGQCYLLKISLTGPRLLPSLPGVYLHLLLLLVEVHLLYLLIWDISTLKKSFCQIHVAKRL